MTEQYLNNVELKRIHDLSGFIVGGVYACLYMLTGLEIDQANAETTKYVSWYRVASPTTDAVLDASKLTFNGVSTLLLEVTEITDRTVRFKEIISGSERELVVGESIEYVPLLWLIK